MKKRVSQLAALAVAIFAIAFSAPMSFALDRKWQFDSIDGGVLSFEAWKGQPVLVVNTASRCGFTHQYDGLQSLYDRYRDQGLIVLAVPSGDFRQELESDEDVKHFCEVNFGLDIPMTSISKVKGKNAHPFYRWVAESHGWVPDWNFNKVLIAPDGEIAGTWRSRTAPNSPALRKQIEALLAGG